MLLEKSWGLEKAKEIIEKIRVLTTVRGFNILKKADPQQIGRASCRERV